MVRIRFENFFCLKKRLGVAEPDDPYFFTVLVLQTIFSKQNFAILSNYKLTAAAECTVVSFCTNEETHRGV